MPGRPNTHAGRGGERASWHRGCLRGGSPTGPEGAAAQGLMAPGLGSRSRPIGVGGRDGGQWEGRKPAAWAYSPGRGNPPH